MNKNRVKKCYVHNCNNSSENSKKTFYKFPMLGKKNLKRCMEWAKFARPNVDWSNGLLLKLNTSQKTICSSHFAADSFQEVNKKRLHIYSVPTLPSDNMSSICDTFVPSSSSYSMSSTVTSSSLSSSNTQDALPCIARSSSSMTGESNPFLSLPACSIKTEDPFYISDISPDMSDASQCNYSEAVTVSSSVMINESAPKTKITISKSNLKLVPPSLNNTVRMGFPKMRKVTRCSRLNRLPASRCSHALASKKLVRENKRLREKLARLIKQNKKLKKLSVKNSCDLKVFKSLPISLKLLLQTNLQSDVVLIDCSSYGNDQ